VSSENVGNPLAGGAQSAQVPLEALLLTPLPGTIAGDQGFMYSVL